VAIAQALLIVIYTCSIYHLLKDGIAYRDLGPHHLIAWTERRWSSAASAT